MPGAPGPGRRPPQTSSSPPTAGAGGGLSFLEQPSTRPGEPVTEGLDVGPGGGRDALQNPEPPEDLREIVLDYIVRTTSNQAAAEMLQEIRNEKSQVGVLSTPQLEGGMGDGAGQVGPEESVVPSTEDELDDDFGFADEEAGLGLGGGGDDPELALDGGDDLSASGDPEGDLLEEEIPDDIPEEELDAEEDVPVPEAE